MSNEWIHPVKYIVWVKGVFPHLKTKTSEQGSAPVPPQIETGTCAGVMMILWCWSLLIWTGGARITRVWGVQCRWGKGGRGGWRGTCGIIGSSWRIESRLLRRSALHSPIPASSMLLSIKVIKFVLSPLLILIRSPKRQKGYRPRWSNEGGLWRMMSLYRYSAYNINVIKEAKAGSEIVEGHQQHRIENQHHRQQ